MAEHNDLGKQGEEIAQQYLSDKGYKIMQCNWRFGSDEIDIIAKKDNLLIIAEVKTRQTNFFGEPEEAVTKTKQKFLIRATETYINQKNIDLETRFDIVSVVISNGQVMINHIEDAFYPTL
jgi:putative endonuclease